MFYNTRRKRPKSFLHWKYCLFLQKFIFSATSSVLKKWSYNFNINCQVTLWTLISCSLMFVMFYFTRRKRPKSFLHWKDCLFLQNFFFQQLLRSWRNGLITSTVNVRILFGPLQIVLRGLSNSIIGEKIGQKVFFTRKFAFFWKLFFQQSLRS